MQDPFKLFKKWKTGAALDKLRKQGSKPKSKKDPEQDSEKNKIIRRLKHRTEYLIEEEKYVQELKSKSTSQFHTAIMKYCEENPTAASPLKPVDAEKPTKKAASELPEEIKLLYREIAKMTHPDKQHEDQEAMIDIFREATTAKDEQKLEELINISFDLDIDISEISIDLFTQVEKDLDEKEKRIVKMRSEASIVWYQASKEEQDRIVKKICPIPKDENKKD